MDPTFREPKRKEHVRLESERLVLREFREDDASRIEELFAEAASHESILSMQKAPGYGRELAAKAAEFAGHPDRTSFNFVVELKSTSETIGTIGISHAWIRSRHTDVGWHFGVEFAGNGYATEALEHMLEFAFLNRQVDMVSGDCFRENLACGRIFHKTGFRRRFLAFALDPWLRHAYGETLPIIRFVRTRNEA